MTGDRTLGMNFVAYQRQPIVPDFDKVGLKQGCDNIDIRNKSELLTSMLKTIEIASVFRDEAADSLNAETAEETACLRKG